jgi:GNAT superfamily N-acetyltransferase
VSAPSAWQIAPCTSDEAIARCHPVMAQLRPHVPLAGFVTRVRAMQREGYRLAALEEDGTVRAVAGFRVHDMLAQGRHLYVDDLVTDEAARSRGHGAALLAWLEGVARAEGCGFLELDSGTHRHGAHRFYFREGMHVPGFHFRKALT